jgi:hypothetical protein
MNEKMEYIMEYYPCFKMEALMFARAWMMLAVIRLSETIQSGEKYFMIPLYIYSKKMHRRRE